MAIYELLWVPLSLVLGGASVLALTFASLRPEPRTQAEPITWDEDLAA